jgi:hypothetical protein
MTNYGLSNRVSSWYIMHWLKGTMPQIGQLYKSIEGEVHAIEKMGC